jgi:hypothetical protein
MTLTAVPGAPSAYDCQCPKSCRKTESCRAAVRSGAPVLCEDRPAGASRQHWPGWLDTRRAPFTVADIAAQLCIPNSTAQKRVKRALQSGLVQVIGAVRHGSNPHVPLYAITEHRDAGAEPDAWRQP